MLKLAKFSIHFIKLRIDNCLQSITEVRKKSWSTEAQKQIKFPCWKGKYSQANSPNQEERCSKEKKNTPKTYLSVCFSCPYIQPKHIFESQHRPFSHFVTILYNTVISQDQSLFIGSKDNKISQLVKHNNHSDHPTLLVQLS